MLRISVNVVVAVAAAFFVAGAAGCPAGDDIEGKNEGEGEEGEGEEGEGEEGEGEEGEGEEGEGEDPCDVPAAVDGDVVIAAACSPVVVDHDVVVAPGASLTLEAGLTLRFADDVGIDVRGDFFAEGTAEAPIVLESNTGTNAGAWRGVTVRGSAAGDQDDVVLTHVTLQHAGGPTNTDGEVFDACLADDGLAAGVLVVTDSSFVDCAGAGFGSLSDFNYGAFDNNHFVRCPTGIRMVLSAIGSVSGNQTFEDVGGNELFIAELGQSGTWAAQDVDWTVVDFNVVFDGAGSVFTIEPQTIHLSRAVEVAIGGQLGGTLNAEDVVFDAQGDAFNGVVVGPFAEGVDLSGVTVTGARIGMQVFNQSENVVVDGGSFDGSDHDICVEPGATPTFTGVTGTVETFAACGL